jgi:GxxExxY protein
MYVYEEITGKIIGAAIEVHRELGPGLLESAYQECLGWEIRQRGLVVEKEVSLPLRYKTGIFLDCGYRLDLLIEKKVLIEVKSAERLHPINEAQMLTYMKLAKVRVGLLLNFNVTALRDGGIVRKIL